jgi:hypothetical protein
MIVQPIALSVAPVAACHESRWPPSMITSSALSDLSDRVVGSRAFRKNTVDDIKLEHDFSAVLENATDASEVFIAHDDRRYCFVNIKTPVVERTNLPKLTTRVVNAN